VTIQCEVFIDDALAPQRHQFLVIPRIGDHILLPGWEASDLAIVEQVVHIAGGAIAEGQPPAVQIHVIRTFEG
jgi:hypothetical protein